MKRFSVRAHLFILVIAAVLPVVVFSGWLALSISDERRGAVVEVHAERAAQRTWRAPRDIVLGGGIPGYEP